MWQPLSFFLLRSFYYVLSTTFFLLRSFYYVLSTTFFLLRSFYYVLSTTFFLLRFLRRRFVYWACLLLLAV
ncbi:hypothetical protein [Halomonas sp. 3A7M]|uniref:hypothetical protein n=1 Tax=Halomonas sp. 3A7M TaxID=2742616 RepID=UPI001D015802|nr:hypothetical protein [Halomonas sp. 3A7M]